MVRQDRVSYLSDDDLVFGVVIDGDARAYPHNIGWWHEIVNDVVGGQPVAVTFCPLTGTGLVFDRTGSYAGASGNEAIEQQLRILADCSEFGIEQGLRVDAGHGLTYTNVLPVARITGMAELNIGHSIVSRAIFVGFQQAVREMKDLIS